MGLDAIVYKNRRKLPLDPEAVGLQLDKTTGEWYSSTGSLPDSIRIAGLTALHKRLGNADLIATLSSEASRALVPANSVLLSSVLHSGSHSGDVVAGEDVTTLGQEISIVRNRSHSLSPDLARLLDELDELIAAANDNQNPIVFV